MPGQERFPRRAEAARATRRKVVVTALALFEERGYRSTSIVAIAAGAGVAEQTVYAAFGNKRTILAEVIDQAIVGDDEPVAVNDRDWMRAVFEAPDPAARLRAYAVAVRQIHARAARIFRVLEVAAVDTPELAPLWQETADRRRRGALTVLGPLAEGGALGDGLDLEAAADVLWVMTAPEVYLNLVQHRGWDPDRFAAWLGESLGSMLLRPDGARSPRPGARRAVR